MSGPLLFSSFILHPSSFILHPMAKPGVASPRRPLVSNSSTLVLSAFLIAAAAIELAADEVGIYVLACGLTGILAYIGLEAARERRTQRAIAAREEEAHRRLNRHLTTPIAPLPLNFDGDPLGELLDSPTTTSPEATRPI
jgi:hypothetical protein